MANVAEIAEEYFKSLNPMAQRIYSDILEVKTSYDKLWNELNVDERSQIIDESIIKPEVQLMYDKLVKSDNKNIYSCVNDGSSKCGQKLIHDGEVTYRDEFSAPFSVKTQSQNDLRLFLSGAKDEEGLTAGSPLLQANDEMKMTRKMREIFAESIHIDEVDNIYDEELKSESISQVSSELKRISLNGNDENERSCLLENEEDPEKTGVLKTGYDFLDNW